MAQSDEGKEWEEAVIVPVHHEVIFFLDIYSQCKYFNDRRLLFLSK